MGVGIFVNSFIQFYCPSEMGGSPDSGAAIRSEDRGYHLPLSLVPETGAELWSRPVPLKARVIQLERKSPNLDSVRPQFLSTLVRVCFIDRQAGGIGVVYFVLYL